MKKITKKDKIYIILLTLILIGVVFYLLSSKNLYGSVTDWNSQHSVIPEYFRSLFYETGDLFPDFALNLGSGQNIYNYSYYGFLNPIILFSYLLPFIDMKVYICISSILIVYASAILFYYFLRSKKYSEEVSFLGAVTLMLSSPVIFHSHRHLMFMNYMPFLILALIGVDKYFKNGNKKLLCISTFLIILTSYYYSIPAIFCIVIYGVYNYIKDNDKITFKSFIKDGFKFLVPILIAILMACILLVPTFYVIISGRMENVNHTKLLTLLIPKINVIYFNYNPYGVGLTAFSLISLIVLFFDKKKENKFLFYSLASLVVFPIINYILNAGMYIDSKTLIPFLPLFVLVMSSMYNKIFNNNIDIRKMLYGIVICTIIILIGNSSYTNIFYIDLFASTIIILLTLKFKLKKVFIAYVLSLLILASVVMGKVEKFEKIDSYYNESNTNYKELISSIDKNEKYNHVTIYNDVLQNTNNIFGNINMYQDYIYSSTNNSNYNIFYFDTFNNPMQSRNRLIISANDNLPFLMFSNNKYVVSNNFKTIGYKNIKTLGDSVLYENEDVLPFMYVSYNLMSSSEFNNYSFPYSQEILLNSTIVNESVASSYKTDIVEFPFKQKDINYIDSSIKLENDYIKVSKNNSRMLINLPDEAKNKIVFVSFDIDEPQSCSIGDMRININSSKNVLTCKEWKYYNGNTHFTYALSEKNTTKLKIVFSKGTYNIKNIKLYYLNYEDISNINDSVTEVKIDYSTSGDKIIASVNALEDGYFTTTIPYDEGFIIKVDGKSVEYEKVNTAFVGFKISKGEHKIDIEYFSPYKNVGVILSIMGIALFLIFVLNNQNENNLIKRIIVKLKRN